MGKGNKPEKYTVYEFYIEPIVNLLKNIKHDFGVVFLGNWMCDECKVVHSRRTKKFRGDHLFGKGRRRQVCSRCNNEEERMECTR